MINRIKFIFLVMLFPCLGFSQSGFSEEDIIDTTLTEFQLYFKMDYDAYRKGDTYFYYYYDPIDSVNFNFKSASCPITKGDLFWEKFRNQKFTEQKLVDSKKYTEILNKMSLIENLLSPEYVVRIFHDGEKYILSRFKEKAKS